LLGCPAVFNTQQEHLEHFLQYQCPKALDPHVVLSTSSQDPNSNQDMCYDVLRHMLDDVPKSALENIEARYYTFLEIATRIADKARTCCSTTVYDAGEYSDESAGFFAVIPDIQGPDNDGLLFSGSRKLVVRDSHKRAFNEYGMATEFGGSWKGYEDIEFRTQIAGDIAAGEDFPEYHDTMAASATAFFNCLVPDCKRDFGPAIELTDFYTHLQEAVHWD
jgi:hypothetical protein